MRRGSGSKQQSFGGRTIIPITVFGILGVLILSSRHSGAPDRPVGRTAGDHRGSPDVAGTGITFSFVA